MRSMTLKERVFIFFFFQAEDGIRDTSVTGVQTCALPIFCRARSRSGRCRFSARRPLRAARRSPSQIGRASCMERVLLVTHGGERIYMIDILELYMSHSLPEIVYM